MKNNQKTNYKFFYKHWFYVQKQVFLPRFETEQLVDLTSQYANFFFDQKIKALEIGSGSGVVALSLALANKKWNIDAVDINPKAIKLSKKNQKFLQIKTVNFWYSNMFDKITNQYDLIIANLPYVELKGDKLDPKVLQWDPINALFTKENGLYLIKKFFKNVQKCLKKKYLIALEIGFQQSDRVIQIIKKEMPNAYFKIIKDFNQIKRFIFVYDF